MTTYEKCIENQLSVKKKKAIYHPDSLVEITGNALNNLPEPVCWSWSVSNVVDWVRYGLKLPQYIVIFKENHIDGKKLILLNCRTLPGLYITDFNDIKCIAKNVRHLYGLPPDTNWSHRRRCARDVYGQYYTYLATKWRETCGRIAYVSLFEYMYGVGMVSRPKDRALVARLPATEYLRGGQCKHESTAVLHFQPQTCADDGSPGRVVSADGRRRAETKKASASSVGEITKPYATGNGRQLQTGTKIVTSVPTITRPKKTS